MKAALITCLIPALAQAATIPMGFGTIVRRDDPPAEGIQLGSGVKGRKAISIKEIPPQSGVSGAKRLRFVYGPFKARGPGDTKKGPDEAFSMDKGGSAWNFQLENDFPRDITILLGTSKLMKKDMTPAKLEDKIYNHHTAFMETIPQTEDIYECANNSIKAKNPPPINIFAGATTEKVEYDFVAKSPKIKTGFYVKKDALLQVMIDLVNFGPTDMFYTENEIEFLQGFPDGYLKSKQTMINPDICGGLDGYALSPPKGQSKFTVATNGVVMKKSGWLVRQRGHLHDGGTYITLEVNDKLVCRSDALYGGPGATFKGDDGKTFETINESTECADPVKLNKGDKIKLTAHFDLDKHPSRPMGANSAEGASGTEMTGGHGGAHSSMKLIHNMMDGGDAEQMAIMFVYFAETMD